MEILLLALVPVVIGTVFYIAYQQAKKRRALFLAFAAQQGWSLTERDDSWTERFGGSPFGSGSDRKAQNVLQGSYQGRPMVAFDYSYETYSTDSKGHRTTTTHRYAVCSLGLPVAVPKLELVPEGLLGRLGTVLGMQDVELESEDFNRRFRVRADHPKFAYDALPPRTMEALLAREAVNLRLAGTDALCWDNGSHKPEELLARLDTLTVLLEGIPSFVWSDLEGRPS